MAANLNQGTQITSSQVQFDNCVDEKYCFGNIAMFYSFFGTCKKNEVDPQKWLTHVINNINDTKAIQLKELLPTDTASQLRMKKRRDGE